MGNVQVGSPNEVGIGDVDVNGNREAGDAAQIQRPFRALGEADDHDAQAVLAGLVVLLDEAPFLERGEQPRRGRLVESQPPG